MSDEKSENLEQLLSKFFDPRQADEIAEDIKQGEQILHTNPAPEPANSVTANIKAEIAKRPAERKTIGSRRALYKAAAVAAGFIIAAFIGVHFFVPTQHDQSVAATMPKIIWESTDLSTDDPELAVLTAEIQELENSVIALSLNGHDRENETLITELEMELIEIETDFWKG